MNAQLLKVIFYLKLNFTQIHLLNTFSTPSEQFLNFSCIFWQFFNVCPISSQYFTYLYSRYLSIICTILPQYSISLKSFQIYRRYAQILCLFYSISLFYITFVAMLTTAMSTLMPIYSTHVLYTGCDCTLDRPGPWPVYTVCTV